MLDIREVNLCKLHIPKTESFESLVRNISKEYENHRLYFTMGHYDLIDISEMNIVGDIEAVERLEHKIPANNRMLEIYTMSQSKMSNKFEKYSSQRMFVFTNINSENGFEKCVIDKFWAKDENNNHLFFVSMLHINADSRNINKVIEKIKKTFEGKNFLYYFTLDYSDVIIFCKDLNVREYMQVLNSVNYECRIQIGDKVQKIVRDSFTLYGICRSYMLREIKRIKKDFGTYPLSPEKKQVAQSFYGRQQNEDETFFAKINISIQNYETLERFENHLVDITGIRNDEIVQFGRHDISFINKHATVSWLILIEYLIDYHTTVTDENHITQSDVFLTFEAIIGDEKEKISSQSSMNDMTSIINITKLRNACKTLYSLLSEFDNCQNYYAPIKEVENSISSIIKNRFAEDFIICMYESFYRFIEYITRKIILVRQNSSVKQLYDKEFQRTFNNYFSSLIALVNSGMHTERSFIQATAFNAVFYDVPPKLMAFYTAIVYKIIDILKDTDNCNYAFIFTPNFSNDITVKTISYKTENPEDRIFQVAINERFFYNPPSVMLTMAHEAAHFSGQNKRMRISRAEKYIKCIVYQLLCATLPKEYLFNNSLIEGISEHVIKILDIKNSKFLYMNYFKHLVDAVFHIVYYDSHVSSLVREFINAHIKEATPTKIISTKVHPVLNAGEYVFECYRKLLAHILSGEGRIADNTLIILGKYKKIFTEAYADLQMIILFGIDCKDYLAKFIDHERITDCIDNKDGWSGIHIKRIAIIISLMLDIGIWDALEYKGNSNPNTNKFISDLEKEVNAIRLLMSENKAAQEKNQKLKDRCKVLLSVKEKVAYPSWQSVQMNADYVAYAQIYSYLQDSFAQTVNLYNKDKPRLDEIKELRQKYITIAKFDDIVEVLSMMNTEVLNYKNKMIKKLK